jgi:hypothetical protein
MPDLTLIKNDNPILDASDLRKIQAGLICEYGNLGWAFDDRCELRGACPSCQERALKVMPDKPRTSEDHFAKGV